MTCKRLLLLPVSFTNRKGDTKMINYPAAFQKGLDAYYEDLDLEALRHFFGLQGKQQLTDFEAGLECATEQDSL